MKDRFTKGSVLFVRGIDNADHRRSSRDERFRQRMKRNPVSQAAIDGDYLRKQRRLRIWIAMKIQTQTARTVLMLISVNRRCEPWDIGRNLPAEGSVVHVDVVFKATV